MFSFARLAILPVPMPLASVKTFTTVSDAPSTPPTKPRTVPSNPELVITRTTPAFTPIPPVRSRPTPSLPSLSALSPTCHTHPRSPLLPTVSPTPRPPSTPLFPLSLASFLLPAAPALVSPAVPLAPRPQVDPVLLTPPGIAIASPLLISRSDPLSSPSLIEEPALVTQPLNPELFDPQLFPLLDHCYVIAAGTPMLILLVVKFIQFCLALPGGLSTIVHAIRSSHIIFQHMGGCLVYTRTTTICVVICFAILAFAYKFSFLLTNWTCTYPSIVYNFT